MMIDLIQDSAVIVLLLLCLLTLRTIAHNQIKIAYQQRELLQNLIDKEAPNE